MLILLYPTHGKEGPMGINLLEIIYQLSTGLNLGFLALFP